MVHCWTFCVVKEWTMSCVRLSNSGCTQIVGESTKLLYVLSQLSKCISNWTLDIVHCFYNIAIHFYPEKSPFLQVVEKGINSEVQIKVLIEPMNNLLGVSPGEENQGTTRGKEKIF